MDAYDHICNLKLIKSIELWDRCKCEKCQKEVKEKKEILESRYKKNKNENANNMG
jgi:hypothetical protein